MKRESGWMQKLNKKLVLLVSAPVSLNFHSEVCRVAATKELCARSIVLQSDRKHALLISVERMMGSEWIFMFGGYLNHN
jgi:hypothetical protein